jgi:hypothetical protein
MQGPAQALVSTGKAVESASSPLKLNVISYYFDSNYQRPLRARYRLRQNTKPTTTTTSSITPSVTQKPQLV